LIELRRFVTYYCNDPHINGIKANFAYTEVFVRNITKGGVIKSLIFVTCFGLTGLLYLFLVD